MWNRYHLLRESVEATLAVCTLCLFSLVNAEETEQRVYLEKKMASESESFVRVNDDLAWQGTPIRVGGKTYQRGLGVHSNSKLVFPLDGEYTSFHVVPGPDDAHSGTIEMSILVDDQQVYHSGPTSRHHNHPRKALTIPLDGANQLTLLVTRSDGKPAGDHASWADAYLVKPGSTPTPPTHTVVSTQVPKHKLLPFLEQHCISCHGPDKQKARVRFDTADWDIATNDEAQRWQDVLDVLNAGEMPPEDEPQPTTAELSSALDTLTKSLLDARRRLTDTGGEIKMRKLNRREYANTIRDLFGLRVWPFDIPEDNETELFDTEGQSQFFTSKDLDAYLDLGRKVGSEALHWHAQPRVSARVKRQDLGPITLNNRKRTIAENEAKMEKIRQKVGWKELGFMDRGDMQIFVNHDWISTQIPKRYVQLPKVKQGRYMIGDPYLRFVPEYDPRGHFMFRVHGGIAAPHASEARKHMVIRDVRRNYQGSIKILGTLDKPQTVEFYVPPIPLGETRTLIVLREYDSYNEYHYLRNQVQHAEDPNQLERPWAPIWLDWMEAEGPFYPEQRSIFEEIILPAGPTPPAEGLLITDSTAAAFIEKFTFHAYRRTQPEPAFLTGVHQIYTTHRAEGMSEHEAMAEVIAIILASPKFLFIHRDGADSDQKRPLLTSRELAVRLAFFLWSRPPDEELYAADLSQEGIISQQIDRMLADPRSEAFRDGFAAQWAEMDRYDAITVDEKEYPLFKDSLRASARKEPAAFLGTLIDENLPARNLIDSDFVTIDPLLAQHYGLDGTDLKSSEFTKVKLPPNSPRGGLMTQAAFLTTGSNGERSSPVIRGALVMEKLLRDKPAPPPPNVPELGSGDGVPRSNREMVQMHQEQAVCASCHKKMDVIGFGLENFDTIGRWRDTELVGDKQVAINPGGTLPGGAKFDSIQSLKATLLQHEDALARELMESMFAYGLGRSIEFSDAPEIERLLGLIKDDGYPIRRMIREVALSPLFRKR